MNRVFLLIRRRVLWTAHPVGLQGKFFVVEPGTTLALVGQARVCHFFIAGHRIGWMLNAFDNAEPSLKEIL